MFFLDGPKNMSISLILFPGLLRSFRNSVVQLFFHEADFAVPRRKAGPALMMMTISCSSRFQDVIRFASAAVVVRGSADFSLTILEEYKHVTVPEILAILDQAG